jgi:hypothetical protein
MIMAYNIAKETEADAMAKQYVYSKNRKPLNGHITPEAYEKLAKRAERNNRSITREFVDIVEKAVEQEEQTQERV